jgi:hypothetical protein
VLVVSCERTIEYEGLPLTLEGEVDYTLEATVDLELEAVDPDNTLEAC